MKRCESWFALVGGLIMASRLVVDLPAAEIARLSKETWKEFAPRGKEVDAIFGDYVLRNKFITLVIARPVRSRHANLTIKGVGGSIIDLTMRRHPNDQLGAFFPHAAAYPLHLGKLSILVDGKPIGKTSTASGKSIEWRIALPAGNGRPALTLSYRLRDDKPYVEVTSRLHNPLEKPLQVSLHDAIRADKLFRTGVAWDGKLFWAYDEWFSQAYGVLCTDRTVRPGPRGTLYYLNGNESKFDAKNPPKETLAPGQTRRLVRRVFPGPNALRIQASAGRQLQQRLTPVVVSVTDPAGPVARAKVTWRSGKQIYGWGRTYKKGQIQAAVPPGEYVVQVEALGRPTRTMTVSVADEKLTRRVELDACGYVDCRITDGQGQPIPAKVAFHGRDGTPDPFFGPDSQAYRAHNLCYTADGTVSTEIAPGKYEVVVSHGPEYDAAFRQIEVAAGKTTRLAVQLPHVVDSSGWVSSDFHSHSSPSGDNVSSQRGRVLNLLAEHIEFAPCTEHNRISSYVPHLKALHATRFMATCPGMELTGSLLPVNHQNAFPLRLKPHRQDGGGPVVDDNPVVQMRRLAMWDDGAEKLVQCNHPDLRQIYSDRDLDGKPDGGFREMLGIMHVVEIHPIAPILSDPASPPSARYDRKAAVRWLELLNLGYRIPGVVNTDAHYNVHGSGWYRNYIKSNSDDPAQIKPLDMVAASKAGHLVMSTGPFMTVEAVSGEGDHPRGIPGDDVTAPGKKVQLKVQVQCANWLDVNRVQILVNGRRVPELNFTRRGAGSKYFGNGVVKFKASIPLALERDAHLVVVAVGEGMTLERIMGPQYGKRPPIAVSNPIFVDVDGGGFQANGERLGAGL